MKISRRKFLKLSTGAVAGSVIAATGYLYANDESGQPVIERVQIPIKNLKPALEGFRIVLLSDFHLYPFTKLEVIQRAFALTTSLKPDLILLGGDYVTREAEAIFELVPVLSSLNAKHGVLTIIGNHDIWTDLTAIKTGLQEARIPVLNNQGFTLSAHGARLYLAGLDDGWSGRPDLQAALADWPGDIPIIVAAHEPDLADEISLDGRVSLQLSGHSHGGQIRLPGIGAIILPYLGRKYDLGLYKVKGMWLYTNRGIGMVTEPVRFNCPPEVTEITLLGI